MGAIAQIYLLALADFRERTRRYSFLITLLGAVFFGYLVATGKWTIHLGLYRGEYNSAWVGSLMASATAIMLGIVGFYLVKNSITRDRDTRVGEILATTPLGKRAYVTSKWLSNFAVLAFMTLILAAAAVAMQLLIGVPGGFNLWALVAPFLFVCLPVMALTAAMAVLFESIWWLRGTVGNILYLFLAEFAFLNSLLLNTPFMDFSGLGTTLPSMEAAALAAYPGADLGFEIGFVGFVPEAADKPMSLFVWNGIDWSARMLPLRLLWLVWAMGITALSGIFFDRFDPARSRRKKSRKRKKTTTEPITTTDTGPASYRRWSELTEVRTGFNIFGMVSAELRLMLKGRHLLWYAVLAGLIAAQSAVPFEYARSYVMPAVWIWPLALWAAMGTRESRYNTADLMLSSPHPLSRQLPAIWVAGILVAVTAVGGMLLRALIVGEFDYVVALLAGIVFVPTLALAAGTVSGSKKLFEVMYLVIWYIGPVNGLTALDFAGTSEAAVINGNALTCLMIAIAAGIITFLWRCKQVAVGLR
jgi:hypothetical protein